MAETKSPGDPRPDPINGTTGLAQDEVIARLVPDPAAPPDVIVLVGFLGKSTRPRFWRLYKTLDLKDYLEIAEGDIVHSESLSTKLEPLGGTTIWVKRGARLQHSRSESMLAEADFLRGDIANNFLAATAVEGFWQRRAVGGFFPPPTINCPPPSSIGAEGPKWLSRPCSSPPF